MVPVTTSMVSEQVATGLPQSMSVAVKGHATDEMLADGRVQPQDRRGNDKADSAADSGVQSILPGALSFAAKLVERQAKYVELIAQAMAANIGIWKEDQKLREDAGEEVPEQTCSRAAKKQKVEKMAASKRAPLKRLSSFGRSVRRIPTFEVAN